VKTRLELTRTWSVGERIGGGGFGQVYAVTSDDTVAVAKFIPKEHGADRELLFVNLAGIRNVVPIIESGETEDHWVLVMPRAEKSLREHIAEAAGHFSVPETVRILSDIAATLADLDGRVVHRDLKPENALFLNGHWCLADFGISRYAEATTAPDTQKYALSPPYAAPERWRSERATGSTDVYALGVIAFELLSSSRPFPGPSWEDYRDQHLHADPPPLEGVPPSLASLVHECLYKAPGARPSPGNLLARLEPLAESAPSSGLAKLQDANRAEVSRRGEAARRDSEARSDSESRAALIDAARSGFRATAAALKDALTGAAPTIIQQVGRDERWSLQLNQATLRLAPLVATPTGSSETWRVPFNVVAHSSLSLSIPPDRFGYEGRSHSLWYCDALEADRYQWFETAFMISPFMAQRGRQDPFALEPGEESAKALWSGIAEFQVAWPFTALNVGGLDEFIGRWASWFAEAAEGRLEHPSSMPERPPGGWRR
jgi:serine/threonine protein kinase